MKPTIDSTAQSALLAGKRLLLVDDNRDNLRLCEALAQNAGAECVAVDDGMEAAEILEAYAANHFDMLVLDVACPVYEAMRLRDTAGRASAVLDWS